MVGQNKAKPNGKSWQTDLLLGLGMLGWLLCVQTAWGQALRPPPEPQVKPLIGKAYPNDGNGDRVDDVLFSRRMAGVERARTAVTFEKKQEATRRLAEMVDVELVFDRQITQRQIDDFLAMGGDIAYVYKAVSYGWTGQIPLDQVTDLPGRLGASLRLVEEPMLAELHMDMATRTGRVRPVWASGFAGSLSGYEGAANITIAIVDSGVDESHTDLNGRRVYWNDFTADGAADPIDYLQHGSHVAGIALGTGDAGGAETGTMHYTQKGSLSGVTSNSFFPSGISLPAATVNFSSTAQWLGGGSTTLHHVRQINGGEGWSSVGSANGVSPLSRTSTIAGSSSYHYSPALLSNGSMSDFVVASQIADYPGVGDGFNKFRGVAPGCSWAGAKVFTHAGSGYTSWIGAAIDALVANRVAYNIKIINLSLGTTGDPGISTSNRQKINTAVNNGIVAVISAGNDGGADDAGAREVDDPGRAAMALTVGAANDVNQVTDYTSHGFTSPSSTPGQEEDYKPDITAPGGSDSYTQMLSVDSNSGDGTNFSDQQSNDYYNIKGTSMASPFVAGCAALVVDALQQKGTTWDFTSSQHARYVKMLLCATANESNANRESGVDNPTLQRAAAGPDGYPSGKDRYEGYGLINPDAAVEAVALDMQEGDSYSLAFGSGYADQRASARRVELQAGQQISLSLNVPATGDYDLYLYSGTPSTYGTPVSLATSTLAGSGTDELITYIPSGTSTGVVVVKRVSGNGTFTLDWQDLVPPPVPAISSSSHPDENTWYSSDAPAFTWTTPSDVTGIAGYSYVLDNAATTLPDTTVDTTGNSTSYAGIADGMWYFHVRAEDGAGNWGAADHYQVQIDAAPTVLSITSTNANGTYGEGQLIDITLTFSEPVTLAGGDLFITLETGDTDREMPIATIADTNKTSGVYTVLAEDVSADLSVKSIGLNGGTLRDATGNDADLGLPAGQNLDDNQDIVVTNDLDGDGLPDWWETQYYGGSTNANPSAIIANGVNTALEAYIAGLDPTDPAPDASVVFSDLWNTLWWDSASGRVYAIYWATNLNDGFQPLETNIHWSVDGFTDTTHNATFKGFYKIDVRRE